MESVQKQSSSDHYGLEKYNALIGMDCCCFFDYDKKTDKLSFSNNMVIPELSGKVIEHCTFQMSNIIVDRDVPLFIDFLHYAKEHPIEFRIKGHVQNAIWCRAYGIAVRDEHDDVVTVIGYIRNVDEQKRENEEQLTTSRMDTLTGVWNHFAVKEIVNGILHTSDSEEHHALLIVDLRNLNIINQRLGFLFGNVVLKNIAKNLRCHLSNDDIIARVGGDEFLLFLKNIETTSELLEKTEAIRKIIQETYIGEQVEWKVSCNIGISLFPEHGTTYIELFTKADKALYEAKHSEKMYALYDRNHLSMPKLPEGQLYYNFYDISELNSYTKSEVNMELVNFSMDLLENAKDVGSAINLLIDKIGRDFIVSNVAVIEKEGDKTVISYSWNYNEGLGVGRITQEYADELLEFVSSHMSVKKCCLTDINFDTQKKDNHNILLAGLFDGEQLKGLVYMDRKKKYCHWSKQEVDSFLFVTRIISFYLLKLRNSEKITEQMEMAKNYDSVTGLPTIHKFIQDTKILCNTFHDTKFAIVYLDIKNFKFINDSLGYDKGDILLKDLAQCLRNASVGKQISARAGADNFITLIPYEDKDELKKRVLEEIDTFIDMQNRKNISYNIGISAGIYMLKEDDKDIMSAIDNANMARKLAKNSTVEQCIFYDDEMEQEIRKEQMIIRSMHSALENEEFQVYLQPKINLETGKIGGAEALVRWRRSDGSMLPPNDFIPLFEKNGFVVNLDFYIYEQVCKILKRWRETGQEIVPISVNVSRVHLYHDDFLDKVLELIGKYEIEPWMMEFELTESIFLNNTVTAITVMKELRKLGFCVSIDDFGAGYSSLNLLKDMRTDVLKLDKEFFRTGEMKEEERIIVSSIIRMAKQLNMKVLSEGVETQMQSDFLKKVECDMAQGYLYAKPLPVNEFEVLLDSYNSINLNNK